MPTGRKKLSTEQNFLKRRSFEQGKAEIDAAHIATQRLYCDALRFWRRCSLRPCKRPPDLHSSNSGRIQQSCSSEFVEAPVAETPCQTTATISREERQADLPQRLELRFNPHGFRPAAEQAGRLPSRSCSSRTTSGPFRWRPMPDADRHNAGSRDDPTRRGTPPRRSCPSCRHRKRSARQRHRPQGDRTTPNNIRWP